MTAPVVVALTEDYVTVVTRQLLELTPPITADQVREVLEVAAVATTRSAPEPDLFGSTP